MKRFSRLLLALSALALVAGCSHLPFIGKKTHYDDDAATKEKKSKTLASDTEKEFKGRWMEKRVGELVGQGLSPDSAKAQANAEFRAKYSVTNAAHD
jgi:hypothetical protein